MCQEACNQTGQSDSKVGILHGRGSMGLKARQLFWVKVDEDSSRSIYNMLQWNVGKHIYFKNVHIFMDPGWQEVYNSHQIEPPKRRVKHASWFASKESIEPNAISA